MLRTAVDLFAGIPVRDLTAARPWYARLLGSEPSFLPNDTEAVWELAKHRFVYIVRDPDRAGSGLITVFVDDLDAVVTDIASRGLEPVNREAYPTAFGRSPTATRTATRSVSAAPRGLTTTRTD